MTQFKTIQTIRFTTSASLAAIRLKSANIQIFRALMNIASAALLVRVMGMFNSMVVTARFGAGPTMDAYFVASTLPLLLPQLIGSAVEAAVIPAYTRVRSQGGKEQASILFSTLLNLLLLSTFLLTLVMLIFRRQVLLISAPALDSFRAGLAGNLAPFIYPALFLMVLIGFLECILNAEGQFGWPAYAGLLVPFTTVVLVLLAGPSYGVVMLCVGMVIGLCLQLCICIVRARYAGLRYRPIIKLRNPEIPAILISAWPVLLGALIGQASPLVDQIFASFLSGGSISALNYALKLISVPTGVIFVSVGRAVLPYLSRQAAISDMKAFKGTLRLYLWAVGAATTTLSILLLALAHPLVQILFQRGAFSAEDTNRTAITLMGFGIGLTPMSFAFITSKAFSALGKTRVLMGTSVCSVIANAVFDYILAHFWQSFGIALATSAVYVCTMLIMLFSLQRMIGTLDLFTPPAEIAAALRKLGIRGSADPAGRPQGSLTPTKSSTGFSGRQGDHKGTPLLWTDVASRFSWQSRGVPLWGPSGAPWPHKPIGNLIGINMVRAGIMLAVFAGGVVGMLQNAGYTLRVSVGSLIVLAFLRYRYALLMTWVLLDAFIGSALPLINGNNFDTALTVPTLLLMTCLPVKQSLQRMPALTFLLLFLVWVFVSICFPVIGIGTFLTEWFLRLDFLAVSVLVISLLTTRERLLRLIDAILAVSVIISLYGIYGYFTRQNGEVDGTITTLFRISSVFGSNAPSLALFLSLVIPIAIYRTFTLRSFKRAGILLVILLFVVTLVLTFTRTAFIGVPLSILVMSLFMPSRRMRIGLLISLFALAIVVVLVATGNHLPIFDRFLEQDITTANNRTYLWQALLDHFDPTQLLGNGLDASYVLLTRLQVGYRGKYGTSPHNLFLGTLYDHGIIGAALLIAVFVALSINILTGIRKSAGEQRVLFASALAILINMLSQCLDSNDLWIQGIGLYFWILVALPFANCWRPAAKQSGEGVTL